MMVPLRSEEHTSELQSLTNLVCRLLLDTATTEIYTLSLHDALPIFLLDENVVLVAVRHHRALAQRELLRRVGRGLHLHYPLLGEFLEIVPPEVPRHLIGRGHDGAAEIGRAHV